MNHSLSKGRKKIYIRKLTTKDEKMLRAFRNCGRLSEAHLKKSLGMAAKRILNFQRDGYLDKATYLNLSNRKTELVYELTEKGKVFVESQLRLSHFYKSRSTQHDLSVADKYLSITPEEQESWKTESELRQASLSHIINVGSESLQRKIDLEEKRISITDGAYTNKNGIVIAVEVVTSHYKPAEIEAKMAFSNMMGYDLEIIKI